MFNVGIKVYRDSQGKWWIEEGEIQLIAPDLKKDSSRFVHLTIKTEEEWIGIDKEPVCQNQVFKSERGTKTACFRCGEYFEATGKQPCPFGELIHRSPVSK